MKRILGRGALVAVVATLVALLPAPSASAQGQYYEYRNLATGRCLDDSREFGLRAVPCNGLSYQSWTGGRDGSLFQNLNTGRCIDSSFEHNLRVLPCNGLSYQKWYEYYDESGRRHFQNGATFGCLDDSIELRLRDFGCNSSTYQSWSRSV
jgi:hypothetical protein